MIRAGLGRLVGIKGQGLIAPDNEAPQSAGKTDWNFDLLALGDAEVDQASVAHHIPKVLSQGASSTCVANSWEQALLIERIIHGYPAELGSRLFGYSNSRALHGMAKKDNGTFHRTYAKALKMSGNLPERLWPFRVARVNRTPPARCFREAHAHRGIRGYYKIKEQGDERTRAMRAALANNKPFVFGTPINRDFKRNFGPEINGIPDTPYTGGHAMCCVGFKRDPEHGWLYHVVNSWGDDWRDYGFTYFNEEWMQWFLLQDIWVVSLV